MGEKLATTMSSLTSLEEQLTGMYSQGLVHGFKKEKPSWYHKPDEPETSGVWFKSKHPTPTPTRVATILAEDREGDEEEVRRRQTVVTWLCMASRNSLLCSARQRLIEACCLENRAVPSPKTYAANRKAGCTG